MNKLAALVIAALFGVLPPTAAAESRGLGGFATDLERGATMDDAVGGAALARATIRTGGSQNGHRSRAPSLAEGTSGSVAGASSGPANDGRPVRAAVPQSATAATGEASLGEVVSSIESSLATADVMADVAAVNEVTVIDVAKVMSNEHIAVVSEKAANNEDGITKLRKAVTINNAVKTAIDANGVVAGDIVAADVDADGRLTLYVFRG